MENKQKQYRFDGKTFRDEKGRFVAKENSKSFEEDDEDLEDEDDYDEEDECWDDEEDLDDEDDCEDEDPEDDDWDDEDDDDYCDNCVGTMTTNKILVIKVGTPQRPATTKDFQDYIDDFTDSYGEIYKRNGFELVFVPEYVELTVQYAG